MTPATTPDAFTERPDHRQAALQLADSLARHGVDATPLLAQAGLPDAATLARDGGWRVGNAAMVTLVKASRVALADDFFGFTEHPIKPGTLHYMFELGLRFDTLGGFIGHCQRFLAQVTDDLTLALTAQGDSTVVLRLCLRRPELDPGHFLVDQLLLYCHRVLCWAVGCPIPVLRVDVPFDEAPNPARHSYWVCRQWVRAQPVGGLYLDARHVTLPVVRTPQEWQVQMAQHANSLPALPEGGQGWSLRLRALLRADLEQQRPPASLEVAAQALDLGPRTLRRYLDKEGASYQQVLDQLLLDEAVRKLHLQRLPIADVAEQLGFAEPRSFSRAFKRWTGVSPTRYSR